MDINDIVKGGDERITLKENGLNKYHGNPLIYESVFNRGSCTMSNLNIDSKRAVDKMLKKLQKEVKNSGLTIIPLKLFINDNGYAKILISLAKGKKMYDKRQVIKERENKRQLDRIKKIN